MLFGRQIGADMGSNPIRRFLNTVEDETTFMPEYVSGWCGHGFKSHSHPVLLTYLKADISLWRSDFYFQIWYGDFHPSIKDCLIDFSDCLPIKARALMLACWMMWHVAFGFTVKKFIRRLVTIIYWHALRLIYCSLMTVFLWFSNVI